jgi:plastocyanin
VSLRIHLAPEPGGIKEAPGSFLAIEVTMPIRRRIVLGLAAVAVAAALAGPAAAQSFCATSNCVVGGAPSACQNRALPSVPTVLMTQSGVNFVFVPSNPKIEPGGCIIWKAVQATHSSSGTGCFDDSFCADPPLPGCLWDAGNVESLATDPTSTCFYDTATYPAGTGDNYYCRIHATPTTGTMRGTLRVTTPIVLLVNKDLATSSVKLTWTGGGVTGDVTYKVARNTGGDPTMPPATTPILNPDGGTAGTTFTDANELGNTTTRYYLVRNKQSNEI